MLSDFSFHHIGVATNDIFLTTEYYLNAGFISSDVIEDSVQNVKICFVSKKGMPLIELVSPIDDKSPVNNILDKSGVSPYHFCYEVMDIILSIKQLKKIGYIPLSKPVPAVVFDNRLICFLYNKDIGLIELLENKVL